jgi:hypothetical protein
LHRTDNGPDICPIPNVKACQAAAGETEWRIAFASPPSRAALGAALRPPRPRRAVHRLVRLHRRDTGRPRRGHRFAKRTLGTVATLTSSTAATGADITIDKRNRLPPAPRPSTELSSPEPFGGGPQPKLAALDPGEPGSYPGNSRTAIRRAPPCSRHRAGNPRVPHAGRRRRDRASCVTGRSARGRSDFARVAGARRSGWVGSRWS